MLPPTIPPTIHGRYYMACLLNEMKQSINQISMVGLCTTLLYVMCKACIDYTYTYTLIQRTIVLQTTPTNPVIEKIL